MAAPSSTQGLTSAVDTSSTVRLEGWIVPPTGWFKLNCDGSRLPDSDVATCDGVVRNDQGAWIVGYSKMLGICSVIETELWAILEGLQHAWRLGCRRLCVESTA
ncbi:hypothetical protein V6N13_044770 [Hibiscus sabdariffa]